MDPLTYIATGVVRDFGPWIVLLVGLAAAVTIFTQLSLVMNMRRTMRAVERLAGSNDAPAVWSDLANSRNEQGITSRGAAAAR